MTKRDYLRKLEEEIILLDEEIADDIIEYYKDRFDQECRYENKSDEEIMASMGTPEELARRIYSSYGVKPDIWESARSVDVDSKKAIPLLLFDVLVASWVIPLLVFITLAGLATFITFPLVIATLPKLDLNDMILVIMLTFGAYAILLLLVLGIAEMSIIVIRNILIMNIKVLSPRNKTTSRLIKKVSLFDWMRRMKMGRNIFINIGMVAISIVAIAFVIISTFNRDILNSFGSPTMLSHSVPIKFDSEIELGEPYHIIVDVGDVEVNFSKNLSNDLKITHEYNMKDAFNYDIDIVNNRIYITTDQDQVDEGLFTSYEGSVLISIPSKLLIDKIEINIGDGNLDMMHYKTDDLSVTIEEGNVLLYDVSAVNSEITVDDGHVQIISSNYQELQLTISTGLAFLTDINTNWLDAGNKLSITNQVGQMVLENVYFNEVMLSMPKGDIYYSNNTDNFVIDILDVIHEEGEAIILVPFEESTEETGQE
ncbi:DUF4097 family beta strand repeat-containing protein [Mycoplasmatota bacterium WC44]